MNYQPTLADAAADLQRCIYASFSQEEFNDPNFMTFFNHAQKIIGEMDFSMDSITRQIIKERLLKAQDSNLTFTQRREDLLMASILLQLSTAVVKE